jgi:hypothetical protein
MDNSYQGNTALAGGAQAGATPISRTFSRFTVVATAGDSCVLPNAGGGTQFTIKNAHATNSVSVFASLTSSPPMNGILDSINGTSNSTPFALAAASRPSFSASRRASGTCCYQRDVASTSLRPGSVNMGKLDHLNAALDEANAAAEKWARAIAGIASQRDVANRSLAAAAKVREQHALAAATGDDDAASRVKEARAAHSDAAAILEDLAVAQPRAEEALAAAKKSAELAQHAVARHQAEGIMLERLKAAERIDAILADLASACADYDRLGRDVINVPGIIPANIHGMTSALVEQVVGDRRLRAALPAGFIRRFFPTAIFDEQRPMKLMDSELQVLGPLSSTGLVGKAEPKAAA